MTTQWKQPRSSLIPIGVFQEVGVVLIRLFLMFENISELDVWLQNK